MAGVLLRHIDWLSRSTWSLKNDFFTRQVALCCHSSGAQYLALVGVNRRTNGWDGVVLVARAGGIYVHHEFKLGGEFTEKAASVAIEEMTDADLRGNLHVVFSTESNDWSPESWVITP